jgi:hypothetical protein
MADQYYLEDEGGGIGLARLQQIINLTAAAVSVGLVVGLVLWGYRLAVRDVTGIPVVLALDEPMRVAPADPGGTIAGNIGLSVNAIAAEGTALPPADQLVLAPRPVELAPEDQPFAATTAVPAPIAAEAGLVEQVLVQDVDGLVVPLAPVEVPTQTLADPALPLSDVVTETLTDPLAAPPVEALPLEEPGELIDPLVIEAALDIEADPGPAPPGAVVRSPRPQSRSTEMVVLASMSAPADEAIIVASVQPEAIAAGTRLVQLGAFDNAADADAEWSRLVAQFGDLIASKTQVIQDAQSGGRNFVRLRAMGFADEGEARRFCSALLSENAACIPVAQR